MSRTIARSPAEHTRHRAMENLLSTTDAAAVWFRTLRRVEGIVRYAGTVALGSPEVIDTLRRLDGQRIAPHYQGARHEDVPLWNHWALQDGGTSGHLSQEAALWRPLGIQSRFHLLVVDDQERLVGLVDVLYATPPPLDISRRLDSLRPVLTATLIAARTRERDAEKVDQEAAFWLEDGQEVRTCVVGRVLWNQPSARAVIVALARASATHRTQFAGPMWMSARPLAHGVLVWALPSRELVGPPLGQLTPAERRVAIALSGGATFPAIAQEMGRSVETVRSHASAIYRSLGVTSRVEVATLTQQVHWS